MTTLKAEKLGRRFNRQWIIRNLDLDLKNGDRVLIAGSNGSGKSTLLRMLAGQLSPTEGNISLQISNKDLDVSSWYRHISWSGPYMDLYTDLTLEESVKLHFSFRENLTGSTGEAIEALRLEAHAKKDLRNFSSGMLQRVKAGLAILSRSEVLMLDEATSNLDSENASHLLALMERFSGDRILLFASNDSREFDRFPRRVTLG